MNTPSPLYDVFLSFRGPDVRETFLSHLVNELNRKGFTTFDDGGTEKGNKISPQLVRAIRGSRICIVIISKNYASSSWTLNELVEIMKRSTLKIVMPVFYKVEPSDVRKQIGPFGDGYKIACRNKTEQEKQRWTKALYDVSLIVGVHSKKWCNDAAMISDIVMDVCKKLNKMSPSTDFDNLVGIKTHREKMMALLCLESQETRMVGIWGPVGIGKTTIARVIYSEILSKFHRGVFMENVKRSYRSVGHDFETYYLKLRLQETFLSRIMGHKGMKINHLGIAKERLKLQKVLVVLDDVDKIEQLEALVDSPLWFGEASRIIVTTQDKQLLKAHGIELIYEVGYPPREEALEIFSQSAFKQKVPPEGYEKLADEVTELTGHLPLGLYVLGKALRGKCVNGWIDSLPRIRNGLNREIEEALSIGYNGLDDEDKAIFLYIAWSFQGERVDSVMEFLANSDLDIKYGLSVLVERALISIMNDNIIIMHRLFQQLGKAIIRRFDCLSPRRCHLLAGACEVYDVIAQLTGTRPVLADKPSVSLASERALHDQQHLRFYKTLVNKVSKLATLVDGIAVLVFIGGLVEHVVSKVRVVKSGFLSIMSMSPPAFANIRFGISRG